MIRAKLPFLLLLNVLTIRYESSSSDRLTRLDLLDYGEPTLLYGREIELSQAWFEA